MPKDGPLPEMYEPVESPVENVLHPKVRHNPLLKYPRVASHQPIGNVERFPLRADDVDRRRALVRRLDDAQHPVAQRARARADGRDARQSLGQKLGVKSGDVVKVSSARGEVTVKAVVTPRMQPLKVDGKEVTVVWMPYNWGFKGLSTGPSVNHLTIDAVDPGAGTQETKACLVNVVKVRDAVDDAAAVREGEAMTPADGSADATSRSRRR